jgi:hypothetical protein
MSDEDLIAEYVRMDPAWRSLTLSADDGSYLRELRAAAKRLSDRRWANAIAEAFRPAGVL